MMTALAAILVKLDRHLAAVRIHIPRLLERNAMFIGNAEGAPMTFSLNQPKIVNEAFDFCKPPI